MYLKALEIQGFKSFPDKTVLTFGEDITAIVGPNGSGKSNISDAILWVMGEQSSRALRGGKMEDVIFGGTQKRKQMGYAEVSLILDNTQHIFDRPETEVMVTRRYYRSGESEYFINKSSCRLKDINELFMDTGLGREGYSIIGQGKVDAILSVKSADRREIFEEAAGISRYRHRKEEAERKLERTADNLLRISDKIEELELQVEPLRIQSEKAKKYLVYRDELRELEISVWMEQLDRLRENSRKLAHDYETAVQGRDNAAKDQEGLYAKSEALTGEMQGKELEAEQIRAELSALDEAANELESAIAVLRTEVKNNLENANRVQQEMEQQNDRAKSITDQIADRGHRLDEIQSRREALARHLQEKEAEEARNRQAVGSLDQEMEALQEKVALQNASAGDARALLSALAAAQQELIGRRNSLTAAIQETADRTTSAKKEFDTRQAELEKLRARRDNIANVISGHELRLQSRRKKLTAANGQSMQLAMEENSVSSRIHMLSEMEKLYEGYSKAVKVVMQSADRHQLTGIRGPVAGLLKVPDQYAVAIEIALGGAMQNIVVEREEDGKAAIAYLKRRDGGRCTFLPMDAIRPNSIQENSLERQSGFVGIATQLISYDAQYQNIFANLLGRVIVAEDMDSAIGIARTYRHRYRIVTLDGQVLNAGGSMTGGSISRSAGILSRSNELERLNRQINLIREKLSASKQSAEEAQRETNRASYDLEVAQTQKQELDTSILKLEGEVGQYQILLDSLQRGQAGYQEELSVLAQRIAKTEAETESARVRITELEGEAAALQAEAAGKSAGANAARQQSQSLFDEISRLKMGLASLEAEEGAVIHARDELIALQGGLSTDQDTRRAQIDACHQRDQLLNAEIAEKERLLQSRSGDRAQQEQALHQLTQARLQLEAQRNQADKEARAKNEQLLALEGEVARLEQKKVSAELEEKQILDKLWDSYELSHSEAEKQRQEIENLSQATRRISELKRSISGLGNVNVGAIDEFQRVNERYTYLVDQRSDVERSKTELETIIGSITEEMKQIFAIQFERISESFTQTFQELFRGGKASLELEDKEDILNCGIEIKVQPPGKSLKIISLLSGGEKAFVAIALYFSILKVRPTPFVVMDEIEAALDDANVTRFARYMRSITDHTQFICITHRRGTMEEADVLYGITMQEQGVSRMLTINLNDAERELNIK